MDIKRDKEKQLVAEKKRQEENFSKSDLYFLNQQIGIQFNNWKKRGEFEKTEEHEKRISSQTNEAYSEFFLSEITKLISSKKVFVTLYQYNADKEQYTINLTDYYTEHSARRYDEVFKAQWQGIINISPENAQKLNKILSNHPYTFDNCKWTIISNNIVPENLALEDNGNSYPIILTVPTDMGTSFFNKMTKELNPSNSKSFSLETYMVQCENLSRNKQEEEKRKQEEKQKRIEDEKKRRQEAEARRIEEEEKRKAEDELKSIKLKEEKFKSFVENAEKDTDNFKDKKPKDIRNNDYSAYTKYLNNKIYNYEQALQIKEDVNVKQNIEKCRADLKEFNELLEKREKRKNTLKSITGF
jgi:hypothetical protein